MENIIYITPEQARITHAKTVEYSGGGTLEEIDFGRLEGVLYNIQNDDWYPTFVDKLTTLFLLLNGYLSVAETFLAKTENICLNVAASKIDKELLHQIIQAIMDGTYDDDESLKLEIFRAISE